MNKNKELTVVIYDNFERKKVFLIKKDYIKYLILTISIVFIGFIVFFIFFLNTKIENKREEKTENKNQVSINRSKELNDNIIKKIDAINNLDNIFFIEDLKISQNKILKFNLKNISSYSNINGYLIVFFKSKSYVYSYPNSFILDSNRLAVNYLEGEEFNLKQNKLFSINLPSQEQEKLKSILVYIYDAKGVLNFNKFYKIGDLYE